MNVAAILGIKDEAELLPAVIDHLYRIGVDLIVARDNHSTDGSAEFLHLHESGRLRLAPLGMAEVGDNELWARREVELAKSTDADWVLFLDADEFWLPAFGSLKDCSSLRNPNVNLLTVNRYNVPITHDGLRFPELPVPACYGDLDLFVRPYDDFRHYIEDHPQTSWISGVPMPKIIVRPSHIASVNLGHHDASGLGGASLAQAVSRDILIAHLPFTTAERFLRKIDNIRELLRSHANIFPGDAAWHWKRWLRIAEEGGLNEEFQLQCISEDTLRTLRAEGVICSAARKMELAQG